MPKGKKRLCLLLSFAIAMTVWWTLTLLYPPLVVPTIPGVAAKLTEIAATDSLRQAIWVTAGRLLAGLALGVIAGTAIGTVLGFSTTLHAIVRPLIGLLQAVPPVSWLVLALIWFGFDGRASVFIVLVGSLPIMTLNMVEGVRAIDPKLLQMATLYRFSLGKRLFHLILPSILPSFRAGLQVAIGIGAKTVVMGEVLTTTSGIGGEITNARLNVEPEGVVAWTVVLVMLYFLFTKLAGLALRGRPQWNANADYSQSEQTFREPRRAGEAQPRG